MTHINRLVLNFPGFETTSAKHQLERLSAGGQKTASLWGFDLQCGDIRNLDGDKKTVAEFKSEGPGWTAQTRFVHFSWTDIIGRYENTPYPKSLFENFPKYFSFFLDKTVRKYREASLRYWIFSIYPILMMVSFALVSWFGVSWALSGLKLHWMMAAIPAFLLFLILCKWPGDYAYLNLSINDWGFARDMVTGANPDIEKRYETFANYLIKEIESSSSDEIIIVGHSFGSIWAVSALAHALARKPKLLKGKRITFLAIGSSLLKIALVKRAKNFRVWIRDVIGIEHLLWHEIQTSTDMISFYKSHPFEPIETFKIDEDIKSELVVDRVSFKHALGERRLNKMKKSMYLAHRQYILYMDKRVHFDFQLRLFGPFFADELARNPQLVKDHEFIPPGSEEA